VIELMRGARVRVAALAALVAAAATLVVVLLVGSGSSAHPRGLLESMFQDDQYLLYSPTPKVIKSLDILRRLGVDRVRVQVLWLALAPAPMSAVKPAGFDATKPRDYPTAQWAPYDRVVRLARARGLSVNFDVTAPGPLWAMRRPADDPRLAFVYAPKPAAFKQFVIALGRRYSGKFVPPRDRQPLPRVNYWSIWNEPNQDGWLAPQWRTVLGGRMMNSPRLYRLYADAAFDALTATGHGPGSDTILVGELAPEGAHREASLERPIPPMPFLRALYCVDGSYRPVRGPTAVALHCPASGDPQAFVRAHPVLFQATGFAQHPYSFFLGPTAPPKSVDYISIGTLPRLEDGLDRIFALYGVARKLPLYLTEYGYETNPPNPFRGQPPQVQARWLSQAQYLAWNDPRVRVLSQFLLVDSPPNAAAPKGSNAYWSTFQTGLVYLDGALKPSFAAYRLPLFVANPSFRKGSSVWVWGMLRPAVNGGHPRARIQWRSQRGPYRTLATVTANDPSGAFTVKVTPPDTGILRLAWTSPRGMTFYNTVPIAAR
jgi:hypothetical protein